MGQRRPEGKASVVFLGDKNKAIGALPSFLMQLGTKENTMKKLFLSSFWLCPSKTMG
jgi:hypothetical protein